ncbi:Tyrosine recombinase XerC [subsurface metagenome]
MDQVFELIPSLSCQGQLAVTALVRQLCENEGVDVPHGALSLRLPTLAEGVPMWEAWMVSQYRPGTARLYAYCVCRILAADPSPTSLSIQQHQASQLIKGISATAVKSDLKALKSFFGYLCAEGLWPDNPVRAVKPPKVPRRLVISPSFEEVAKLLSVVDNSKMATLLCLAIDAGIRFREATSLTWGRINLDRRTVNVIGKGDRERVVLISSLTCEMLQRMRGAGDLPGDLVFPSRSIEGWDNRGANRILARLCRKAGIKKYTCHQFRHFFATHTIQHGGDLIAVSEILGHVWPSTTVDFYVNTDPERIRDTHERCSPFAELNGLALGVSA